MKRLFLILAILGFPFTAYSESIGDFCAVITYESVTGEACHKKSEPIPFNNQPAASISLTSNRPGNALPGYPVYYPHTIKNTSNIEDIINLSASSSNGWSALIFCDLDKDGLYQENEPLISDHNQDGLGDTGRLGPGEEFKIIILLDVPKEARIGNQDILTLTAVSSLVGNAHPTSVVDRTGIWRAIKGKVSSYKFQVRNPELETYYVKVENEVETNTLSVLTDEEGHFSLPIFEPGRYKLQVTSYKFQVRNPEVETLNFKPETYPDTETIALEVLVDKEDIVVYPETMVRGKLETLNLKPETSPDTRIVVKVFDKDEKLVDEVEVDEEGRYEFRGLEPGLYTLKATDQSTVHSPQSIVTYPKVVNIEEKGEVILGVDLVALPKVMASLARTNASSANLTISLSANRSEVGIGEVVTYQVAATNSGGDSQTAKVVVHLPDGFNYKIGSGELEIGNWKLEEKEPDQRNPLTWELNIPADDFMNISFKAIVGAGATNGPALHKAYIYDEGGKQKDITSLEIVVKRETFYQEGIIIGRVVARSTEHGARSTEQLETQGSRLKAQSSLGGIVLYLEDGSKVTTDPYGKFSIPGPASGWHILRLDKESLDRGWTCKDSFKFVDLPEGGMAKVNFEIEKAEEFQVTSYKFQVGNPELETLNLKPETLNSPIQIISPEDGEGFKEHHITIKTRGINGSSLFMKIDDGEKVVGRGIIGIQGTPNEYDFYKVPIERGPHTVTVIATLPDSTAQTVTSKVHRFGLPETIEIKTLKEEEGEEEIEYEIAVRVRDQWGVESPDKTMVTVSASPGKILNEDVDPGNHGHQLYTKDGEARFRLRAKKLVPDSDEGTDDISQTIFINAKSEKARASYRIETGGSPSMPGFLDNSQNSDRLSLMAVAEGIYGHKKREGDSPEDAIYQDGKANLYLNGPLFEKVQATLRWTTENLKDEESLFRHTRPGQYYPVYGDSSKIQYQAQSNDNLFAKLERKGSYLLWGDYHTTFQGELNAFNRSLQGLRANLAYKKARLDYFSAYTDQLSGRIDIAGQGISIYDYKEKLPDELGRLIEGSEKIRVQTRERYHEDVILKEEKLRPETDYTIEYNLGILNLKQPVPSRDENENPTYIVMEYEYLTRDPFKRKETGLWGTQGIVNLSRYLDLLGTYIKDETDTYELKGAGLHLRLKKFDTGLEYAKSSKGKKEGEAYRAEVSISPLRFLTLRLNYHLLSKDFENISGSLQMEDEEKYRLRSDIDLPKGIKLNLEHYRTKSKDENEPELTSSSATVSGKHKRLIYCFGLEDQKDNSTHITLGRAKLGLGLNDRWSFSLEREQPFGKESQDKSSSTNPGSELRTSLGLDYKLEDKTTAYLRHRIEENLTTLGASSKLTETTEAYAKYEIKGGISGENNQAVLGMKNRFRLREDTTFNLNYEHSKTENQEDSPSFHSVSTSLEYLPDDDYKASLKYELKKDGTTENHFGLNLSGKLNENLGFMLSLDKLEKAPLFEDGGSFGLAFRPLENDRLNFLAKFQIKDRKNRVDELPSHFNSQVGSIEGIYQLRKDLSLFAKYASKKTKDKDSTKELSLLTDLYTARINYQPLSRLNLMGEYRVLDQHESDLKQDYTLEIGYAILKNLKVAVGYTLTDYQSKDIPDDDYKSQGPYLKLYGKISEEDLWFLK